MAAEWIWSSTNVPSPDYSYYLTCLKFPWKIPLPQENILPNSEIIQWNIFFPRMFFENNQQQLYNITIAYGSNSSWANNSLPPSTKKYLKNNTLEWNFSREFRNVLGYSWILIYSSCIYAQTILEKYYFFISSWSWGSTHMWNEGL